MRLLGLSGPAGSGKSSAAQLLREYYGFAVLSFADPIRADVLAAHPLWSTADFLPERKDNLCLSYGFSPRSRLQAFGEHARGLDPTIYVRHLAKRVEALRATGCDRVVIDDVRLPDEARYVRAIGGQVVHVKRAGVAWSGLHATEQGPGVAPEDLHLPNPAKLDLLRVMVGSLVSVAG